MAQERVGLALLIGGGELGAGILAREWEGDVDFDPGTGLCKL